jgi:hypothetical protein
VATVPANEVHPCPHCRDQLWFRRAAADRQHLIWVDRTITAFRRSEQIEPERVRPRAGWECGSCGRVANETVAASLDKVWLQLGRWLAAGTG